MKKFLFDCVIVAIICAMSVSCTHKNSKNDDKKYFTEVIKNVIQNEKDPCFTEPEEFTHYVINKKTEKTYEDVLCSVPTTTLCEIARICKNKYGKIRPYTVAREYIENYETVYKYMFEDDKDKDVPKEKSTDIVTLKKNEDTIINIKKTVENGD